MLLEALLFLSPILLLLLLQLILHSLFPFTSHKNRKLPPSPKPQLPIIGHMHLLSPNIHQSLHRLSLRYGPLFSLRFGSVPCVVASTPCMAKQFLHCSELSFASRIQTAAIKRLTYDTGALAFAPHGPFWNFTKKLSMNELLGSRSLGNFKSIRSQELRRLLRLLAEKAEAGEAVNLTQELLKLTNNVISRMMIGEAEEAKHVTREVTEIFGEFNLSDFIWIFKKLDLQGTGKRIEGIFERFDALIEKIITRREVERRIKDKKYVGQVRDFLDILLDCSEDGSSEIKITRTHIKALVMDFLTGGTDVPAVAAEWALVELINHPEVLRKAQEDINNVIGKDRLAQESDSPNLPYLEAIVKETLRLHPPVPLVTRICEQECKIEGYVIPEGTLLFVNSWAIGRDPKNWENPLSFKPERFMNSSDRGPGLDVDVRGQHFNLIPFGSGRRICPGRNLALVLLPALVGAIVQCFDFKVVGAGGEILSGADAILDRNERPGLTVPRAQNLVCVPVARSIPIEIYGL